MPKSLRSLRAKLYLIVAIASISLLTLVATALVGANEMAGSGSRLYSVGVQCVAGDEFHVQGFQGRGFRCRSHQGGHRVAARGKNLRHLQPGALGGAKQQHSVSHLYNLAVVVVVPVVSARSAARA